jgi:ketosteroid isomerase-like protein
MKDDRSPEEIVDAALAALVTCLRARDSAGALELFSDDAALFGSGVRESARGATAMKAFFDSLFEWPFTVGWTWAADVAQRSGDLLWFVCPAMLEPCGEGSPADRPYRLSGVLRRAPSGEWRFELFNGAEPVPE